MEVSAAKSARMTDEQAEKLAANCGRANTKTSTMHSRLSMAEVSRMKLDEEPPPIM